MIKDQGSHPYPEVVPGMPSVPPEMTLAEARRNLEHCNTGSVRFWQAVNYACAIMDAFKDADIDPESWVWE